MTTFAPLHRLASPMRWQWLFRLVAALLAMAIAAALALQPAPARAAAASQAERCGLSQVRRRSLAARQGARRLASDVRDRLQGRDFRPRHRRAHQEPARIRQADLAISGQRRLERAHRARPGQGRGGARLARQSRGDLRRRRIRRHGHLGHGDRIRRLRGIGQRRFARSRASPSSTFAATIFATN